MPELPETETIAGDLRAEISGATIKSVQVHRDDVLREITANALGTAATNSEIVRVWRRAKLVVLDVTQSRKNNNAFAHIVVQPRFTGALLLDDGTLPPDQMDYLTVTFALSDGRSLHYRDVRRLGTVSWMSSERFLAYSSKLGPEPLDPALTNAVFSALVRGSKRPVKTLLMDQARLAGVGNIYANEALWRAGIDPSRVASGISEQESATLLSGLREILCASIKARGTSFRDYRDARGRRGEYVAQLAVYGRGGEQCLRCGRRLIETHAVDGRTTVFCAECQR